jgi:hypothetical protein
MLEAGVPSVRPTLVLIPGWRLTASIWSHQIETFGKERRVLAIDDRYRRRRPASARRNAPPAS